jgi:hypothetical protein
MRPGGSACGNRFVRAWKIDLCERHDRPLDAVLDDGEISSREAADRFAVPVEHADVHLHDVDASTEGRERLRRGRLLRARHGHERGSPPRKNGDGASHRLFVPGAGGEILPQDDVSDCCNAVRECVVD